jgi:hypothetical protein
MSHSVIIINNSLLEIFDPTIPEYAGVRDHFSVQELEKIDVLRAQTSYSFADKLFVCWALDKAVMAAENP